MTSHRDPLSHRQLEVLTERELAPHSPIHNIGGYHEISGAFERRLLELAIHHTIANCDVLRLVLRRTDDSVVQEILRSVTAPFEIVEVEDSAQASARAAVEMRAMFAIFDAPLYRFTLYVWPGDHALLNLVFHHVIIDGWALTLLFQRICAAYNRLESGMAPETDYPASTGGALTDGQYKASSAFARDEAFWNGRFPSLPPPALQRIPKGLPPCGTGAAVVDVRIPRDVFDELARHAERAGATAFHACVAVIYGFFARLREVDDIVLGVSLLNRRSARERRTIGMFTSSGSLRIDGGIQKSIIALSAIIGAELKAVYRHHRYPVSGLLRRRGLLTGARERLCDITLSYLVTPPEIETLGVASVGPSIQVLSGHTQSPVQVFVADQYDPTGAARFVLVCGRDYFGDAELAELGERLGGFVEFLAAFPDTPLSRIPMLLKHEQPPVRAAPGRLDRDAPQSSFVHEMLSQTAERTPKVSAVVFADRVLTYADLERRANQLANHLRQLGVVADTVVGLSMDRSLELIIGMFAVLKAGAAFVVLEPNYPPGRLIFMAATAKARLILTVSAHAANLRGLGVPLLRLDTEAWALESCSTVAPARSIFADSLAYIIFTSGSTGEPKGVMVSHRGLHNLAATLVTRFGIHEKSRVLQFARFSFDASISEVLIALHAGATLYLTEPWRLTPGRELAATLRSCEITYVALPPSALARLANFEFPSLEALEVAGEACPAALAKEWAPRCRRFFNAYGPSEATVCATVSEYGGGPSVPIGCALDNVQVHVLDRWFEPVPAGATGELFIGGIGLARGYLGEPAMTAAHFVANPFCAGGRMYRTGDFGRILASGELEFMGRRDQRIKIRGFRIELAEIETALLKHPAIREAVVDAGPSETAAPRLIAFITLSGAVTSQDLRAHLRETLPDYMIPAAFITLDALPLTSNGKVDRAALQRSATRPLSPSARIPAGDSVEAKLAAIFSEVLSVSDIDVHENFFEVGADSLQLGRLLEAINLRLSLKLRLVDVFRHSTIASLAEHINPAAPLDPGSGLRRPFNRVRIPAKAQP